MGPTIFLPLYNAILDITLISEIGRQVPNVDPHVVLDAGATRFRSTMDPQDVPGIIAAYATSVDRVFYLVAGVGAAAFCAAWGMGWKDIRKKNAGGAPEQPPDPGAELQVLTQPTGQTVAPSRRYSSRLSQIPQYYRYSI